MIYWVSSPELKAARWAVQEARREEACARGATNAVVVARREEAPWAEDDAYHAAAVCIRAKDAWGRAAVLALIWALS